MPKKQQMKEWFFKKISRVANCSTTNYPVNESQDLKNKPMGPLYKSVDPEEISSSFPYTSGTFKTVNRYDEKTLPLKIANRRKVPNNYERSASFVDDEILSESAKY
jgi:hypothetical protein